MIENLLKRIKPYRLYVFAALVLVFAIILTAILTKKPQNEYTGKYKNESSQTVVKTYPVNFDELYSVNEDVCAWIYIPGSEEVYGAAIDYPVLQSSKEMQEDFYLNHDIYGEKNKDGSIYIQKFNHNDFSDFNTIIYGHDLANRKMFTPLRKYRDKDFFDKNQYIYIYLPDRLLKYHIFAAFVHSDTHLLYEFDFANSFDRDAFLSECFNPASKTGLSRDGAQVTNQDKIITLSTCTLNEGERFLVVAKLSEEIKYE